MSHPISSAASQFPAPQASYQDCGQAIDIHLPETAYRRPGEALPKTSRSQNTAPAEPDELGQLVDELALIPYSPADIPHRITLCKRALTLLEDGDRVLWAAFQQELGDSLAHNPWGWREDNIEQAIGAYQQALRVYSRAAFPEQWAALQNNLGIAYADRVRGSRADNLELAISAHESALEVYSCADFPQQWAATLNNLGAAYLERTRGARAENVERAIAHYESVLTIYTAEAFPEQWAAVQNNLGAAYSDRMQGKRIDNLVQAAAAYELALSAYNRAEFPVEWRSVQNSLRKAKAYLAEARESMPGSTLSVAMLPDAPTAVSVAIRTA